MISILISIDGSSKRNGEPTCTSLGVAWIQTDDGDYFYNAMYESCSTNQRGEINGLLEALKYAANNAKPDEDIIIITDSEYVCNTVAKDWVHKWRDNNWRGSTGDSVKNKDMWEEVARLLDKLNNPNERVFMQWIKGHLIAYTPANIKRAMEEDQTGIELLVRIVAKANMKADKERIIDDVIYQLEKHDKVVPPREVCHEWAISNTMADCIASYLISVYDEVQL